MRVRFVLLLGALAALGFVSWMALQRLSVAERAAARPGHMASDPSSALLVTRLREMLANATAQRDQLYALAKSRVQAADEQRARAERKLLKLQSVLSASAPTLRGPDASDVAEMGSEVVRRIKTALSTLGSAGVAFVLAGPTLAWYTEAENARLMAGASTERRPEFQLAAARAVFAGQRSGGSLQLYVTVPAQTWTSERVRDLRTRGASPVTLDGEDDESLAGPTALLFGGIALLVMPLHSNSQEARTLCVLLLPPRPLSSDTLAEAVAS
jgi:hypothetical protein